MSKIPLLYKDRRLDGDTPLRQAQLITLHLLEVMKELCRRNRIRFWLAHGTILGALRHGGCIPWDDDADVWILKTDYLRFLEAARVELPDDVYLDLPEEDEALRQENNLTRLRDNYSTGLIRHNKRLHINDHHGVNIDILVLEECGPRNCFSEWALHSYMTNRGWYRRAHYDRVTLRNLFRKWYIGAWVGVACLLWKLSQLFTRRDYLLQTNFYTAWRWWMPRDWFIRGNQPPRIALYEGVEFPIPYEAEAFLEMQYGDWRRLPPEEKRRGYLGIILPTTPCFHSAAMEYPKENK